MTLSQQIARAEALVHFSEAAFKECCVDAKNCQDCLEAKSELLRDVHDWKNLLQQQVAKEYVEGK